MGLCRILHDAHMFRFIHLVENHPKNHYYHNFLIDQYQLYLRLSFIVEASKSVPQLSA